MGFPVAVAVAVARQRITRANEIDARLKRVVESPAWIADSYHPEIASLRDGCAAQTNKAATYSAMALIAINIVLLIALVIVIARLL